MNRLAFMLMILPAFAGCAGPGPGHEIPTSDCQFTPCLAIPDNPDYQAVLKENHAHLLTNDVGSTFGRPSIDGDLIAWLQTDWPITHHDTKIYAYSFGRNQLLKVATDSTKAFREPRVSDGRILFTEANLTADGFPGAYRMRLWDSRTETTSVVRTGLGGEAEADAFWHSWILFENAGSRTDSENGLWALDTSTNRLVSLYSPPRTGVDAEGLNETLRVATLREDVAYVGLVRNVPGTKDRSDQIFRVNLTNGERQIVYQGLHRMGEMVPTAQGWLLFSGNLTVYLYEPANGIQRNILPNGTVQAGAPAGAGDWILIGRAFGEGGEYLAYNGIMAYDVVTGRSIEWTRLSLQSTVVFFQYGATDGHRVAMVCGLAAPRIEQYQICWADLPQP